METIVFVKAQLKDAEIIVQTRREAWNTTYRGIYPDEVIDNFDYDWHNEMERRRLSNPSFHCWMVMDGAQCVGYFSCGTVREGAWRDFSFRLHSLYLLPDYRGCGLGGRIFRFVKAFCQGAGYDKMYLDCHPDNKHAMEFYKHMGGTVACIDAGHENRQEDACTIEYFF